MYQISTKISSWVSEIYENQPKIKKKYDTPTNEGIDNFFSS